MGQKHCGEKKDVYVYSWDPTVEIIFLSMESDTGSGFFLKWKSSKYLDRFNPPPPVQNGPP